ncbi:hypothetical protein CC56_2503 [Bordetella pertussis H934]|nr:hypothetical protein CC56_2503 [Bordetella pertussis H934]
MIGKPNHTIAPRRRRHAPVHGAAAPCKVSLRIRPGGAR